MQEVSMWNKAWREQVWSDAARSEWDLIIIGGGITGAGILREATRVGLRAMLIEGGDFACGTSSRSTKMVHGGLRYMKNLQIRLTYESVREREHLLQQGRGLVNPLGFIMPSYRGDRIPGWVFGLGLIIYDILALKWGHSHYPAGDLLDRFPPLRERGLLGGYRYLDAQTDDARLVLRVLREAVRDGATVMHYARVEQVLYSSNGSVCGVLVRDTSLGEEERTIEVMAPIVINATGAWADDVRGLIGGRERLRRLRGSHLVFPLRKLPLPRAVSFLHPMDFRPIVALPWEGVALLGTTDVDHEGPLPSDPAISPQEVAYLLEGAQYAFPSLNLGHDDVLSTFSGVRAVKNTGKADPSKESREHVLWFENGLLTVTGGKLTTFRVMAHDTLRFLRNRLPQHTALDRETRMLDHTPREVFLEVKLDPATRLRLCGRYGTDTSRLLAVCGEGELDPIPQTPYLWAELRWAAHSEGVMHLDDLLLRRIRLGIVAPQGGIPLLDKIKPIVQAELGWDESRWDWEAQRYKQLWQRAYAPPGGDIMLEVEA